MELDFSKIIDEIAAGRPEDRAVQNPYAPVKAPPRAGGINVPPATESLTTGRSGSISTYKKQYRIAWDFHEAHNPPTVDADYWKTHTPGEDEPPPAELEYWEKVTLDIAETAARYGNSQFLTGLLMAVYDELEREYERRRRSS